MNEQQRLDLISAEMFIETAFGSGDDSWKQLPEFSGMDESDMAWCAHGLIQFAVNGSDSKQLAMARYVLAKIKELSND